MSRTYRKAKPLFRHYRGASVIDYRNCAVAKDYDDGSETSLTRARRRVWNYTARRELAELQPSTP